MCGIAGIFGPGCDPSRLRAMVAAQVHRGPDDSGLLIDTQGITGLGHNRLSIIDLSETGHQPMTSASGHRHIVFNGEIYNYLELRAELADYPFRSQSDTEVLLAAYEKWGEACLDKLIGMFAFLIWDSKRRVLFAARDRWGVKPLYYALEPSGRLLLASEIPALWSAGIPQVHDPATWASYLCQGLHDHSTATFWSGIRSLAPGHWLKWRDGHVDIRRWYDLARYTSGDLDSRSQDEVEEEYTALLENSIRLRFRADVPVGIALSGGLDSSLLLGLTHRIQGEECNVTAFTYTTGNPAYDELPWVREMIAQTRHPLIECPLRPADVPRLADSVQVHECEPFGGIPTLAYARLFEIARQRGVITIVDGQGMDEQWAGYDYYQSRPNQTSPIQGTRQSPLRPECLVPDFARLNRNVDPLRPYGDAVRDLQYRDIYRTKLPKALRFNDRVSMRSSVELREPFLDHRLFELALRQPEDRKLRDGVRKWTLRRIAGKVAPRYVVDAPKRPVQTPQREWLQGPLREWANDLIESALASRGGVWLDPAAVRRQWQHYLSEEADNSFYVWQWISLGLASQKRTQAAA